MDRRIVVLACLVAVAFALLGCASAKLDEGMDSNGRAYRGNGGAALTIYEYSDFECPFCGIVQGTLKDVMNNYGQKMKLEYRHYPLPIHPRAMPSAIASVCAEKQGKFWQMYDLLFANQKALQDSDLQKYAKEIGLDEREFSACLSSDEARAIVQKDMALAPSLGVRATPTFIIGETAITGAQPYDTFRQAIEIELAKRAD